MPPPALSPADRFRSRALLSAESPGGRNGAALLFGSGRLGQRRPAALSSNRFPRPRSAAAAFNARSSSGKVLVVVVGSTGITLVRRPGRASARSGSWSRRGRPGARRCHEDENSAAIEVMGISALEDDAGSRGRAACPQAIGAAARGELCDHGLRRGRRRLPSSLIRAAEGLTASITSRNTESEGIRVEALHHDQCVTITGPQPPLRMRSRRRPASNLPDRREHHLVHSLRLPWPPAMASERRSVVGPRSG